VKAAAVRNAPQRVVSRKHRLHFQVLMPVRAVALGALKDRGAAPHLIGYHLPDFGTVKGNDGQARVFLNAHQYEIHGFGSRQVG
jgi:hypothetical protein